MNKEKRAKFKMNKEQVEAIKEAKPEPIKYEHVKPVKHSMSAVMIVKNEADMIRDCLESIKDAVNEIVILDTGSTDATVSICEEYTKKVYRKTYKKFSFSQARKDALKYATSEYVFIIDADERLGCNVNFDEVINVMEQNKFDACKVQFDDYQNGTHVSRCISNARLMKRNKIKFFGSIHNQITGYQNPMATSNIIIKHVGYSTTEKEGRKERLKQSNEMLNDELISALRVNTNWRNYMNFIGRIKFFFKFNFHKIKQRWYQYISRSAYLQWQIAVMHYSRQEYDKAIELFDKSLGMRNYMSDTVVVQAFGYLQQCHLAKVQKSIIAMQNEQDETKKQELIQQTNALVNVAMPAIEQLFGEATKRDPNFIDAYFNAGVMCYFVGRWNDAKNLLIKYMQLREQPARYEIMWYSYPKQQEAIKMIEFAQNELIKLSQQQNTPNKIK